MVRSFCYIINLKASAFETAKPLPHRSATVFNDSMFLNENASFQMPVAFRRRSTVVGLKLLYRITYFIKLSPVISSGWGTPKILSIVGAISQSLPPSRREQSYPTTEKGTGFVVCAVKGVPSGSNI